MQFVVPQFIEVESKVIGPISVRQFIILLFTAGVIFIWYSIFSTVFFAISGVITLAIGGVFAFVRINSQPFHEFALSVILTAKRPALGVWHRDTHRTIITKMTRKDRKEDKNHGPTAQKPTVSESHIAELSLIADTAGKYSPEDLERLRQEQASHPVKPVVKPPNS